MHNVNFTISFRVNTWVCLQYAKDYTEAQDILQDGFIKMFTKIDQYDFERFFWRLGKANYGKLPPERFRKHKFILPVFDVHDYDYKFSYDNMMGEILSKELLNMIQTHNLELILTSMLWGLFASGNFGNVKHFSRYQQIKPFEGTGYFTRKK